MILNLISSFLGAILAYGMYGSGLMWRLAFNPSWTLEYALAAVLLVPSMILLGVYYAVSRFTPSSFSWITILIFIGVYILGFVSISVLFPQ